MEGASEEDKQQEEDVLVSRLMARIAELEERLYQQEFNQPTYGEPTQPMELVTTQPKLGFLSAIKEGLRQLEESTGYSSASTAAPPSPQPPQLQPQPSHRGPRIIYYQTPPQEVVEQLQHTQVGSPLLQVETSQASGSSTATGAAADWISRLTLGSTASARGTPSTSVHNSGGGGGATPSHASAQQHNGLAASKRARGDDLQLQPGTSHSDTDSLSLPGTPLAQSPAPPLPPPGTPSAQTSAPPAPHLRDAPPSASKNASDWFSSFFTGKKDRASVLAVETTTSSRQSGEASNERVAEAHTNGSTQPEGSSYLGHRYAFDPADIAAEMEVTARVRKAAAEALMAAEEKLRAAEQSQATLQQQLAQAQELSKEIEFMRAQNEAALRTRSGLEDEIITARGQVENMKQAQSALEQELEAMRNQAGIWKSETSDEQDKLRAENQLLRSQMQKRLSELATVRGKLNEAEAARQRSQREIDELQNKIEWLTRINKQLESSVGQLEQCRQQAAEAQDKFMKERTVRRKLHEQLQQLRGNIRVMCRVRPVQNEQASIISYPLEGMLAISPPDKRTQEFEFDHVFSSEASQEAVYQEVSSLVRSCADGYNVCIFAYGQTGSGKTYTMEGPEDKPGINIRALQELFSIGAEEGIDLHWRVQVSMLEIYNDQVYDLMLPAGGVVAHALEVSAMGAGDLPPNTERVPGATWREVTSLQEVRQVLREGSRNRATAATAMNASSSRSHAVLSVRVTAHHKDMSLRSTLHLVDLAGSERVDKSEAAGQQLKEAQAINKSLSALGDVISALQRRTPHIPFRNSKLTQVLQDSLCGNSKVMLVCNISPEGCSASETLSSLNFASRAAQVELGFSRRANVTVADKQQAAAERPHPLPTPPAQGPSRGGTAFALHSPASKQAPVDKDRHSADKDAHGADKDRNSPSGRHAGGMRPVRSSQNLSGSQNLSKLGGGGSGDKGSNARAAH